VDAGSTGTRVGLDKMD